MKITLNIPSVLVDHLKSAPDKGEVILAAIASMKAISEAVSRLNTSNTSIDELETFIEDVEDITAGYVSLLDTDDHETEDKSRA